MALSGNTRELSLADLILVKSNDSGTYRLRLTGPAGDGLLLMRGGRVVHAAYGELPASDAAYLLVTEEGVDFDVESDVEIAGQTLDLSAQELLIEAMRRFDEGILKRPKPISLVMGRGVSSRREPPRPRSYEARKTPEAEALRRATGRVLFAEPETSMATIRKKSAFFLWAAPLGVLAAAVIGLAAGKLGISPFLKYRNPVKVSDLGGPRDALPVLLLGGPAVAPPEAESDREPIALRIRIDERGNVHPQRPVEVREGRAAFVSAAAEALAGYRFSPALREGVPVPVEMNWTVEFVRVPEPGTDPEPVDERFFTDPTDEKPELLTGEPPRNPVSGGRLPPQIQCRVLIDEEGNVAEASVVGSKRELAVYERAALDAVRGYRFKPGKREGRLVPTWKTMTVTFATS